MEVSTLGQLEGLTTLVVLQEKARACRSVEELGYLLANDTALLRPQRQAVLWRTHRPGGRSGRVAAVSGVSRPQSDAPFVAWTDRLARHLAGRHGPTGPVALDASAVPDGLARPWESFFAPRALWLPLTDGDGRRLGGLLIGRDAPWTEAEIRLLAHWVGAAAHALESLVARRRFRSAIVRHHWPARLLGWGAVAGLVAALWLPVPLSVLAPAEVVPSEPEVVRSPLDGVVDEVSVRPNQPVKAGQVLAHLDESALATRLEVARRDLLLALAELQQASQAAVTDARAQGTLSLLKLQIERHKAELDHVRELLGRVEVTASRDGIAVFADATELSGRPVRLGERLMTVADPARTELEVWLPVDDRLAFPEAARVDLFPNVRPETVVPAHWRQADYMARVSPEGVLGFRVVADFADPATAPRLGERGIAKIHGRPVPLYYYLFRRPLAKLRQWVGY